MNSTSELAKDKRELDKIELKDIFKNLKNDYFLQKIFNNLMKKKSLDIIRYNKNIKQRINISIKDYKDYSEAYSSIKIEIKIKPHDEFGKFIHSNEENEIYYHIYINDNKEEIKKIKLRKKIMLIKLK